MASSAEAARSGLHWHAAGASVRGVSHGKSGAPCQDSHAWREIPGGAVVIAVADGAGSASLSQIGSARAALSAVEWVVELLTDTQPSNEEEWREMLAATLQTAHESVLEAARKRNVTPRDLATTLIVQIATPNLSAAVQVGDGAAVVMSGTPDLYALTSPQRGEFANETVFFTDPRYLEVAQYGYWEGPVRGIAAISDGLQNLAIRLQDGSPYPAFFNPLFRMTAESEDIWEVQESLHGLLRSDRIRSRADDDLTLVLATLHNPEV